MLRALKDEVAQKKAAQEKVDKQRQKVLDDAMRLHPKEVLREAVLQIMQTAPKAKAKSKSKPGNFTFDYVEATASNGPDLSMVIETPPNARRFTKSQLAARRAQKASLPKNGLAPGDAQGHSSKGKGLKGKAAGKTKGKGNLQQQAKGSKGGGKGKEKSKGSLQQTGRSGKGKWRPIAFGLY